MEMTDADLIRAKPKPIAPVDWEIGVVGRNKPFLITGHLARHGDEYWVTEGPSSPPTLVVPRNSLTYISRRGK